MAPSPSHFTRNSGYIECAEVLVIKYVTDNNGEPLIPGYDLIQNFLYYYSSSLKKRTK